MKTQLLCTFCSKRDLDDSIELIKLGTSIVFDKIYVFESLEQNDSLICTYNVEKTEDFVQNSKTMAIHRKKETNTLYTINALNRLILKLNKGHLDKSYEIDWNEYFSFSIFFNILFIFSKFFTS